LALLGLAYDTSIELNLKKILKMELKALGYNKKEAIIVSKTIM
jgi:hypothetical protein